MREIICQIELTPHDKVVWQWLAYFFVRLGEILRPDFCGHSLRFCRQSIEKQIKDCPWHIFLNNSSNKIIFEHFLHLLNENNTPDEYQIYVYKRIHIPIIGICQKDIQSNRLKFTSYLFFGNVDFFGNVNIMITY